MKDGWPSKLSLTQTLGMLLYRILNIMKCMHEVKEFPMQTTAGSMSAAFFPTHTTWPPICTEQQQHYKPLNNVSSRLWVWQDKELDDAHLRIRFAGGLRCTTK